MLSERFYLEEVLLLSPTDLHGFGTLLSSTFGTGSNRRGLGGECSFSICFIHIPDFFQTGTQLVTKK